MIEITLTFIPIIDKNHSCKGCVGERDNEICQALPDCMGTSVDGIETVPGSKGHGVVWMMKAVA